MSTLPTGELFKDLPEFGAGDISGNIEPGCRFIQLYVENSLNVAEATALRDWLNAILPDAEDPAAGSNWNHGI